MSDGICYVRAVGGLGNQLFQIAAGYAYAKKYNKELRIDPCHWVASQGNDANYYKDTIFKNFKYGPSFTRDVIGIQEKQFNFSEIPDSIGSVSLNGYYQSLKYFEDVKDEFISMLDLPEVDHQLDVDVAIHIRRGDYLKYKNIHYVCDTEYFKYFFDKFKDKKVAVFTDSPDYVTEEFSDIDLTIIHSESDLKELAYMANCDTIVGSNSTFSWWASLIGNTVSYFPSKWFADGRPHEDIFRDNMILHDV